MKKADAILAADIHLREDTPVCRIDNYWAAQEAKIDFLANLQQKHECKVLVAGDLFHHWKPSPALLHWAIESLPTTFAVAGNHDLPEHNLALLHRCGMGVLSASRRLYMMGKIEIKNITMQGFSHGEIPEPPRRTKSSSIRVAVCHTMTWTKKRPYPGCVADEATKLLRRLKGYDLVLTGDNHEPFVAEDKGRLLVNPGSMMRMTAAQADHKPRVYLWYADDNTVEPAYFPIEEGVITRKHIDRETERDERIEAFVKRLRDDVEIGLSFEKNLEEFFEKNKTAKPVKQLIMEVIG